MENIEPNGRIADLVGILYVLNFIFKDRTDLYRLEKELEVDIDDLMPIVYTAERLGYVSVADGDIWITDKGKEYIASGLNKRKEMLRDSIIQLEPFNTASELKEFTLQEIYEKLLEKGIQTYNTPSGMRDLEVILIEWGLYSGMLRKTEDGFIFSLKK
ncbi:MAG: AAA-associated domain-containing protein [Candidatus Thermoplasmatota archaeon]|nr:AAA-associated domain-containing protein [Candidatus Thermoplasmatota archaeon]MCL5731601.1 AAA-associated domain-containing protein [Candidatus Thermoplasmatota archaeon]